MLTSLFPTQGLQNFIDEASNLLVASSTMSAGTLGGNGLFRSSIVNRAPITDISQNLKPSMGIERVQLQSTFVIPNEFGPNGEVVYGMVNDDRGLFRYIGSSGLAYTDSSGSRISPVSGDYMEITFYGTALNILIIAYSNAGDLRATVDGGTEGSNLLLSYSNILLARNYASNQVVPVVSGLSLGIHTVKLRCVTATPNFYGYEVINESANLITNPGSSIVSGRKLNLAAQDSQSYNSSFTNTYGVAGAKGGHVLVYQASDGSIKKDIQYTDASQLNLTSADHTNEEVARVYGIREFGAGRSDDFSIFQSNGNYAFTLDDGTTTLVANQVVFNNSPFGLYLGNTGSFITFTFVGTGVDIGINANPAYDAFSFIVDGTTVGTVSSFLSGNVSGNYKVVSGLPYGTHTLKITRNAAAAGQFFLTNFKVYQPKKPTLPAGAIELADYNLMATYSATSSNVIDTPSTGILRKMGTREARYVDGSSAWSVSTFDSSYASGFQCSTTGQSSYIEYVFFGTGIEWTTFFGGAVQNDQISIDGSTNLTTSNTSWPNIVTNLRTSGGSNTFTASTGTIGGTGGSNHGRLQISGLPLGIHKIKVINNAAPASVARYLESFDVITPIHSHKPSSPADFQNTSPIGSMALSDNRQNQPLKNQALQKSWSQATNVSGSVTTTSTILVPLPDMSLVIKTSGNPVEIKYCVELTNQTGGSQTYIQMLVNGVAIGSEKFINPYTASAQYPVSDSMIVALPAGTHKIDLYWHVNSGTGQAASNKNLSAREL